MFAFNGTSSGTWTADDSAAPLVTLAIDHPTVTASGFSFAGLTAQETVDTSAGGIF